ncbi:MAG: ATP-binding cassette domain-containing protein [Thermoplasmata archaeon]|nr:ATP-binding cassette domain-containing protein [Thermoplasmata archaeon]
MPLLSLQDVSFRYPSQQNDAIRRLSFEVHAGEFVGILGGDGSGKSTLAKILNCLIPKSVRGKYSGEVLLDGIPTSGMKIFEIVRRIGLVTQDPEMQLFTDSVEEELAFGQENLGVDAKTISETVGKVLREMDMENVREKSPAFLSGGQKQKVAISAILAMSPDVIVLDEPLSMLDPRSRISLLEMLSRLKHEHGISIVLLSQEAEDLPTYCDRIVLMDEGKIVKTGSPVDVLTTSQELISIGVEPPQLLLASEALIAKGILRKSHPSLTEIAIADALTASIGREGGIG